MELVDAVYNYYYQNFLQLTPGKQFHFATRIGAWRGDNWALNALRARRNEFTSVPLAAMLKALIDAPRENDSNAHEIRAPYLAKYPQLSGLNKALFRVRHLEAVYGIDARKALFSVTSQHELNTLRDQLLNDPQAIRALSTIAINYLYLLEYVIYQRTHTLPIEWFYKLGDKYDLTDKRHIQLLIYLYTHCIIGDTNFYTKPVSPEALATYQMMLERLNTVITQHFYDINLDNKLEFLVCSRICGIEPKIADKIYSECMQSASPNGTFIVDTLNTNQQVERGNYNTSEHRNALFIMSGTPYVPHSTLVTDIP